LIAPPLTVVKVGGSLLGDAADLRRIADAVARRRLRGERLLVVVSALRGVTDLLDEAARNALDPRSGGEIVRDVMDRLHRRHRGVLADLPGGDAVWLRIRPVLDGAERLLTGIRLTGELSDRSRDLLLAHGERFSAPIVAAAVAAAGADARAVTAEEAGLRARGPFHVGSADLAASAEGLTGLSHELHDRVLVLTGFYGIDGDGNVVLFGRGGTDYTAGVAAAGLSADAMELWKDVPGFMSADPAAVPGARRVEELSFDEACELGYYGARILHPRCLDPLRGTGMDVSVRSIHDVDSPGTRLVERREGERDDAVAALAARSGVAVVRVQGAAMVNQPGVAGSILAALGDAGVNVDAVATSMTSLSCTVDEDDAPLARRTLKLLKEHGAAGVETIGVETGAALLGVVGDGLAGDAAMPARMLSCLADLGVPVALISHGPGDVGLSCAVPRADLERALVALHATFFGGPEGSEPDGTSTASRGEERPAD
jgi:aspartate kinase